MRQRTNSDQLTRGYTATASTAIAGQPHASATAWWCATLGEGRSAANRPAELHRDQTRGISYKTVEGALSAFAFPTGECRIGPFTIHNITALP